MTMQYWQYREYFAAHEKKLDELGISWFELRKKKI